MRVTDEHITRAFKIAQWYGRRRARRAEISDLESAALEGLAKAARDFDPPACGGQDGETRVRHSFWSFAFKRILGEMRDEMRRLDHLTRDQRALVAEDANGELVVEQEALSWLNPQEPLPLDASVAPDNGAMATAIVDLIQEPRDPIESLEFRDAFCRAGAELSERARLVLVKRELEGVTNGELAEEFDITEGRASQLRAAALEQMREHIGDSFLDAA